MKDVRKPAGSMGNGDIDWNNGCWLEVLDYITKLDTFKIIRLSLISSELRAREFNTPLMPAVSTISPFVAVVIDGG